MEYKKGDFSFIKGLDSAMWKQSVENAYKYVEENNLWSFFQSFEPDKDKGFMFERNETLQKISKELDSDGHSGASFAITMRSMQLIAQKGWNEYVNVYLGN